MIQKLVDYVQSKVSVTVNKSLTTTSQYLKSDNKLIRISDHFGQLKPEEDIIVIIPETPKNFIISVGYKIYCYTSFRKVGDLLVNYIIINDSVSDKFKAKVSNQSEEIIKLKKINTDLQNLNKNLMQYSVYKERCSNLTKELTSLTSKHTKVKYEVSTLLAKQTEMKKELKEKDAAIKEAVDLIETLTTDPDSRELLYSKEGKKYYLDNFPEETQKFLKDVIKEYYNKKD